MEKKGGSEKKGGWSLSAPGKPARFRGLKSPTGKSWPAARYPSCIEGAFHHGMNRGYEGRPFFEGDQAKHVFAIFFLFSECDNHTPLDNRLSKK